MEGAVMTTTEPGQRTSARTVPEPPTSEELRELVADVRARTGEVAEEVDRAAERVPELVDAMRTNAVEAARAVQTAPEPTLGIVTAVSIGLASGLLMAGAPRIAVAVAAAPAAFIGAALLARRRTA
jgi:hypothetical protein